MFDVEMTMGMLKGLAEAVDELQGDLNRLAWLVAVVATLCTVSFLLHLFPRR